ncbi:MAG: NAD(P)/FAD-dependent oxidoreductase, partial [Acidimicrobiia bacterium]
LDGRPDLVAKCLPDYPPFGKRILIDNGWFRTLRRPNVSLVTEPIDRIEPDGIRTGDGDLHPVDVIVQATGFRVTDLGNRLHLVGRDGLTLAEAWADDDPTAHLGITVPGFPNLFVMYGPNTNAGHGGSIMWLAETQSRYIAAALRLLAEGGHRSMEVRPEVCEAWTAHVDERHEELVWTHPGVTTYYRNGAGKVRSPMPIRLVDYWQLTREPDPAEFVLG